MRSLRELALRPPRIPFAVINEGVPAAGCDARRFPKFIATAHDAHPEYLRLTAIQSLAISPFGVYSSSLRIFCGISALRCFAASPLASGCAANWRRARAPRGDPVLCLVGSALYSVDLP